MAMDPVAILLLAGLGLLAARALRAEEPHGMHTLRAGSTALMRAQDAPFPEMAAARDAYILDAVQRGDANVSWGVVRSSYAGHEGEFRVFADALKVHGVRVTLTAAGQQRVADAMGCMLLTLKLSDLIWAQRQATLPPLTMSATQADLMVMSTVARMVEYSRKIDAAIAALATPPEGIVSTVGKHWVIDDALLLAVHKGKAANYGWHNSKMGPPCATSAGGSGCHVLQGPGYAHNLMHTDYSQNCVLVSRDCSVDGAPSDLMKVLQDPVLSFLASHKGPMHVLRQPGV